MKKGIFFLIAMVLSSKVVATTEFIHHWAVGSASVWQTAINFANMCNKDDVQVTLKFWKSDGALLANQPLSAGQATDDNGEIRFNLTPHQSGYVFLEGATVGSHLLTGNASITSEYSDSGLRCLVGGYSINVNTNFPNNPSFSFLINSGKPF